MAFQVVMIQNGINYVFSLLIPNGWQRILHQWNFKDCTVFQSTNNIWCKWKICNQSKYLKTQNMKPDAFHISNSDAAYVGLWIQVTYCWTYKVKSVIPSQLLRTCDLVYTANKMWLGENPRWLVWKLLLICFSLIALLCNSYLPKIQQLSGEACIKTAG